jgi:hypothetical protein
MIGIMAIGGDAFADRLNAFNRIMNLGHELAGWFKAQYGTTQCSELTRCHLSTSAGVQRFVASGCVVRCGAISREVALRVGMMVERAGAEGGRARA